MPFPFPTLVIFNMSAFALTTALDKSTRRAKSEGTAFNADCIEKNGS